MGKTNHGGGVQGDEALNDTPGLDVEADAQPGAGTPTPGRGLAQGADTAPAGPPASTRRDGRERGLVDLVA